MFREGAITMRAVQGIFYGRICYGYIREQSGQVLVDEQQATTVVMIFDRYLRGDSLAGIADFLSRPRIQSPSGNMQWTRAAIDKLLSNPKYVPHIVSPEKFLKVQEEKIKRSNQEMSGDGILRKATRYSSKNVLSGLLVCGECGADYRRITRPTGEVVWRCANRVEHGHDICRYSPSIPEADVIDFICRLLDLEQFDPPSVKDSLETISINRKGKMIPKFKPIYNLSIAL